MTKNNHDNLFSKPLGKIEKFSFDKAVVDVFPDMIRRSVPGYETILAHCGELAARYVQAESTCYDLGCSLGATSLAMRSRINVNNAKIVSVDNSQAMLSKLSKILESIPSRIQTELVNQDVCECNIDNASMVVLNFTLQFVPKNKRRALIEKIYNGLNPGGCLVISEKLHFEPESLNWLLSDLHHQFKSSQGYSDLEISQKRDSLENVLIPETLDTHIQRLNSCGFKSASPWFQCFNFCSLVAIK
ncbi:MAG: carboxy-S-adenosyl-L-methionine synthase CmoA [Porticoccaceae bacterium]|nr:carboxy-S-adenosyl-L-methionine synthase CmoA [Porticoccaceae bacterium]